MNRGSLLMRPSDRQPGDWVRAAVWLAIIAVLGLLGWQLINVNISQPRQGPAPDFTLTTFDGLTIHLADLRGQVVVVNFWASWCTTCADAAPDLEAAWQKYRDQGVMIVGIDYLDTEAEALAYLDRFDITYPNGPDLDAKIAEAYHKPKGELNSFPGDSYDARTTQPGHRSRTRRRGLAVSLSQPIERALAVVVFIASLILQSL
jgi:cytochrome c biogenesis protein CcmG/thiol:disulfide interchange protein DsbE